MFASKTQHSASGIIIFDEEIIIKEMLFTEFQAILEGVIGEADLANAEYKAIYFEIDKQLNLKGAVCFNIGFDEQGCVKQDWNLPLQKLLANHAKPLQYNRKIINIFDKKICPNKYNANHFWQLESSQQEKIFEKIEQLIQDNTLGLFSSDAYEAPSAFPNANNIARGESKEQVDVESKAGDTATHYSAVQYNETHHQDRLRTASIIRKLRRENLHLNKKIEELLRQNSASMETIKEQELLMENLHNEQKREIRRLNNKHKDALLNLEERFRKELQSKLIDKSSSLSEMLDIKEAEALYLEEQINQLQHELDGLRQA